MLAAVLWAPRGAQHGDWPLGSGVVADRPVGDVTISPGAGTQEAGTLMRIMDASNEPSEVRAPSPRSALVTVASVLAETDMFAGLSSEQLQIVAGCGSFIRVAAGAQIFREGQVAERFYVLRSGGASLSVHAPGRGAIVIQTLGPGDTLGWSWLFAPHRYQFDCAAREPVAAIAFDGACLRGKCEADHELGYQLMSRFARLMHRALDETRLRIVDVYGP